MDSSDAPSDRRAWLFAVCWFVFLDAIAFQLRGPLLPVLAEEFGASESLLGLVAPASTAGFIVVVLALGAVAGRIRMERAMLAGAVTVFLSLVVLGVSPTYVAFLGALFVRGVSTGLFRGVDRPVLTHLFPERLGRVFNVYGLAWAIGASVGPVVVVVARALGDWRLAYWGLAVGFLPLIVFFYRRDLGALRGAERPLRAGDVRELLSRPAIAGVTVGLIFSGGVEGTLFTWLPYYASQSLPASLASLSLSAYLLGYLPGRMLYSRVADRIGYLPLVLLLVGASVPTIAAAFFVASGAAFLATIGVLGFLWSGVFPTLIAFGVDQAPDLSGPINAVSTAASYLGIAVVPAAIGLLADAEGIEPAMRAVLAVAVAVLAVLLVTRWRVAEASPRPDGAD
jgi:fucose permease